MNRETIIHSNYPTLSITIIRNKILANQIQQYIKRTIYHDKMQFNLKDSRIAQWKNKNQCDNHINKLKN